MSERPLGRSYRKLFSASVVSNLGDGISAVAWPWLASAITRNGLLVALVTVAQRLPWLIFSLPAGALTDRHPRRLLMSAANAARATLTGVVAVLVWRESSGLASPSDLDAGFEPATTNWLLYATVLVATLLLGMGEVLYDNTAQTIMPSLVDQDQLERANGRMWSAEMATGDLIGPAAGALLLGIAFPAPFVVDGLTFGLSAALIWLLPTAKAPPTRADAGPGMRAEIVEGLSWLWGHELMRPLAITLGLLNGANIVGFSTIVLFAQEILDTSPLEFAIMMTGGAVGAIVGGWTASRVSDRIGPGPSLLVTLVTSGTTSLLIGLASHWLIVWLMLSIGMYFGVVWNVITVSLRQSIIPDALLGRVNSVYRFIGWGSMPIGAALGGLIIVATEAVADRTLALRLPWIVAGVLQLSLVLYGARHLTTQRIEHARAAAS